MRRNSDTNISDIPPEALIKVLDNLDVNNQKSLSEATRYLRSIAKMPKTAYMKNIQSKLDHALIVAVITYDIDLMKELIGLGAKYSNVVYKVPGSQWEGQNVFECVLRELRKVADGHGKYPYTEKLKSVIALLLAEFPDIDLETRDTGRTILHFASSIGDTELVNTLLSKKADIEAVCTMTQFTPLHCAASFRHVDLVKLLISRGARTDQLDSEGKTVLQDMQERIVLFSGGGYARELNLLNEIVKALETNTTQAERSPPRIK